MYEMIAKIYFRLHNILFTHRH